MWPILQVIDPDGGRDTVRTLFDHCEVLSLGQVDVIQVGNPH
ncbi:MAG: hypothetical protein R3B97_00760 [Dehalococcoidia bacterium]